MLAVGMLARRTADGVRRRCALLSYLYLLWSAIFVMSFSVIAIVGADTVAGAAWSGLRETVLLDGPLWYLAALAGYVGVARLTRRVAPAIQLVIAATLWQLVTFDVIPTLSWGIDHLIGLYVFFLAGVHGRRGIIEGARRIRGPIFVLLLVLWVGGCFVLVRLDPSDRLLMAVMPLVAVPMTVSLAALLARLPMRRLSPVRGLARVGGDTLRIYVLHPLVLALLGGVLSIAGIAAADIPPGWAAVVVSGISIVTAAACLGIGNIVGRLRWTFALPARVQV